MSKGLEKMSAKKIVLIGLFIAVEVILTRFLSIQTPIVRIGFTFLPIAISAIMFGPFFAGIVAALADVIGMMLFPLGMAFFPGFTLSAFLTGISYGLFLYKKSINLWRISISVLFITVVIHLGLDTIWLWLLTGQGIIGLLPARILKCLIMLPIQIISIQAAWKSLSVAFKNKSSLWAENAKS